MSTNRRSEQHHLTADEYELVAQTHQPALGMLADDVLADIEKRARERRDRAGDIARRQRRELRGKGAQRGQTPIEGDAGSRMKLSILAAAVKRINKERGRRAQVAARSALVANARKALAMKQAADAEASDAPKAKSAGKGMRAKPSTKAPKIGRAGDAGRVSQRTKKAQAKRDAR